MGNSEAKPRASPITASSDASVASLLKQFTNSARPDDPPNAEPSSGNKQEQTAEEDEYPRRRGVLDCFYYVKFGSCKYGMNCQFNHPPKPSGWPAPAGDRHEQELAAAEPEYPRRPGEPDCAYYVKFGSCKYGMNCMFNHPPKPSGWPAPAGEKHEQELAAAEPEYPWRPWEPDCSYYVKFGSCKYGMNCKFNHPPKTSRWPAPAGEKQREPEEAAAEPEYPRRPGEPDCSYYVKFGSCKYGMNCKFNHPLRKLVPKGSGSVSGGTNSSNSSEASSSEYKQSPKGWCEYEGHVPVPFPVVRAELDSLGRRSNLQGVTNTSYEYFPGKACKYNNHEVGKTEVEQVKLNFLGLPLRPGTRLCSYYMCSGMCEFGSNCKFHHPEPESEHENCDASRHAIQGSSQLNFSSGLDQEALKGQSVPFLAPSPSCRRSGIIPPQGVYPYPECTGYQIDENKQGKPDWDPFAAKVFCGLCADEVLAGNRPTNHLNAIGYNNLCTKFNEKTKRGYNHEQLKSKWEELEKDYQIWKALTGSQTVLGCDPKKNATYASPEWWAEKTESMPDCGKFRFAPLENVDLLNIMFGDIIMDSTAYDANLAIKTTIGSEQCFGDANDIGVIDKDVEKQSEETTLRSNKEPNSLKPKTNNVHAALTHLVDIADKVNPSNSTTSRRINQVGCGISEIMELVVDAGAGEGSEEHFIATQLFIIPEYRQMFLTLKTPQGRLGWLKRMCQGKEKQ